MRGLLREIKMREIKIRVSEWQEDLGMYDQRNQVLVLHALSQRPLRPIAKRMLI